MMTDSQTSQENLRVEAERMDYIRTSQFDCFFYLEMVFQDKDQLIFQVYQDGWKP